MNPDKPIDKKFHQSKLHLQKHIKFVSTYHEKFKFEYEMVEYLRMSALYWASTALDIAGKIDLLPSSEISNFCRKCFDSESGGFSAAPGHDAHILYTLSAVQLALNYDLIDYKNRVLFTYTSIDKNSNNGTDPDTKLELAGEADSSSPSSQKEKEVVVNSTTTTITFDKIITFLNNCQNENGSFSGCPRWKSDVDSRFSFCAIATAKLLKSLNEIKNLQRSTDFIIACNNFDGGFGTNPNSESHSGQIFCCVAALKILNCLNLLDQPQTNRLSFWLAERQLPKSGGLNGRPEKLPDVCYSWWVLSSLKILNRIDWIDGEKLAKYILASQDEEFGGIADRPGDWIDPFHTLFGLAGLSMLGYKEDPDLNLKDVNPVFCMSEQVLSRHEIDL